MGTYSEVRLYELSDKGAKLLKVLGTSAGEPICYMVMCVAFSSDSRWLAATTWTNKRVLVWNADNGVLRGTSPSWRTIRWPSIFIPGQDRLVIGLHHKGVVLWDAGQAETGSSDRRQPRSRPVPLPSHRMGETAIVVGEWGGAVRLFDLHCRCAARPSRESTGTSAIAIALSSDGKLLATGGGDDNAGRGYLHLFDVVRRKEE